MRVRRDSDNLEADIGLSGSSLDTAALLAHVGAGNGYVVTWYDQSGNGNDATQANTALQPLIVDTGVVHTQNGIPSLNFNGGSVLVTPMTSNNFDRGQSGALSVVVLDPNGTASNEFIAGDDDSQGNDRIALFYWGANTYYDFGDVDDAEGRGGRVEINDNSYTFDRTALHTTLGTHNKERMYLYQNTDEIAAIDSRSIFRREFASPSDILIGSRNPNGTNDAFGGSISEVQVFGYGFSTNGSENLQNEQATAFSIP